MKIHDRLCKGETMKYQCRICSKILDTKKGAVIHLKKKSESVKSFSKRIKRLEKEQNEMIERLIKGVKK